MAQVQTETTILGEPLQTTQPLDQGGQPTAIQAGDNQLGEWMAQYVGEGKKYRNPDDVAKAYAHLEAFVETLKSEKQALAQELEETRKSQKSVDAILAELRGVETTPAAPQPPPEQPTPVKQTLPPIGETQPIEETVEKILEQKEAERRRREAEKKVWSKLDEIFESHDKAKEAVTRYIGGDQTKLQAFNQLGLADPDALVKVVVEAVGPKKAVDVPTEEPKQYSNPVVDTGELTWAKAQQIRKSDPKYYNSREFQVALHKAASVNPNFWR